MLYEHHQRQAAAHISCPETVVLFAQPIPSQNLGFIDPKATVLSLTVAGHDFTIHQSPTVLTSDRAGGTTGAGE